MASKQLPLGAVRTEDGEVVVPASRRADGSVRKTIRIRQGYVPQDEVPKYKTVAQRKREEQGAKQVAGQKNAGNEPELSLQPLTLESKAPAVASTDQPASVRGPDQSKPRPVQPPPPAAAAATASRDARERKPSAQGSASEAHDTKDQRTTELKQELSKLNKLLKEIGKLEALVAQQDEDKETAELTLQQQRKVERKQELQRKRNEIIAELNGAAISSSTAYASHSSKVAEPGSEESRTAKKKTFVAIEM